MVKLVDTGDLKSPALIGVPVQVRLRAPLTPRARSGSKFVMEGDHPWARRTPPRSVGVNTARESSSSSTTIEALPIHYA